MRNKLNDNLSAYATEQSRTQFSKMLEQTEEWLYGEGEDVPKSVYAKKLEELRAIGEPIKKRKFEDENRYEAVIQLRGSIQTFILTAESEDPKYDHIDKAEKQKVIDEAKKTETWLTTEMTKQDKLSKNVDPTITVSEINKKKMELEKFSNPILNKPKPKPKEEPKKEEEKPTDGEKKDESKKEEKKPTEGEKKDEPKKETQNTQQAKSNEPNVEMDLD